MRLWSVPVRITRAKRCREGFYLVINRSRLHFKRKSDALAAIDSLLSIQRIQVVTVREYVERNRSKIKALEPNQTNHQPKGKQS